MSRSKPSESFPINSIRSCSWNEEVTKRVLNEQGAEAILQLPFRRSNVEDIPFWNPNPKGWYLTKKCI